MISINENKGFSITFSNGWTVSVQIGVMNYCSNRDLETNPTWAECSSSKPCPNAEIASFKGDEWHDFGSDTVKGWCKPDEILDFMNMIKEK